MPHDICPVCNHQGQLLKSSSENASVNYYRCDYCGHVWSYSKRHPDSPAKPVTEPPKPDGDPQS